MECHEGKYDKLLLKEGFTLAPASFYALKDKYIAKFYKKMTEEGVKWERAIYTLEVGRVQVLQGKGELKLDLPSVLVANEAGEAVLIDDHGETPVGPGDVLAFPAGEANGHHLHNRSGEPCVFVAVSAGSREADSGEYPDIDMVFDADGYARKDGTRYPTERLP